MSYSLAITRMFARNPNLPYHRSVFKREITPLHQLYFNVVHKMITPRKERHTEVNYLDFTLIELLNTGVKINFPSLIIKHMQRVLLKDEKGHVLPYGF